METACNTPPSSTDASGNSVTPPESPALPMEQIAEMAKEILNQMLPLLSFQVQMAAQLEPNFVRIRLKCDDAGRLIGRRGSTVNEIQFLVNRILQKRHKNVPRIFLDVEGDKPSEGEVPVPSVNQSVLPERLKALVEKVRRWGEPAEIDSLTQEERTAILDYVSRDREIEVVVLSGKEDREGRQKMRIQTKV